MAIGRITTQPIREAPYSGDWIDQSWHREASCAGSGEDMVTPPEPSRLIYQYCNTCPVIFECAEEGVRIENQRGYQTSGIWGGVFIPSSASNRRKGVTALREAYATLRENGRFT